VIESRRLGAVTVFEVHGRLTRESGLRPAIHAAFDQGSATVVLNLEKVSGIDSSGLSELLRCESSALDHGGRVVICSPSAKANAVILVAQLHRTFNIYPTEGQALASVRES
jgi:anti-anti-sigma factor